MPQSVTRHSVLTVYDSLTDLPEDAQGLIKSAQEAAQHAYAKYSEFLVGAAVLMADGSIITGNNQENACYPAGLCAERVAFFAAKSQKPDIDILKAAVVARRREEDFFRAATPCGICRQVMSEYENNQEHPIVLYMMDGKGKFYESASIDNLLPFKFSEDSLRS